jgi:hypothetical protein
VALRGGEAQPEALERFRSGQRSAQPFRVRRVGQRILPSFLP